MVLALGLSIAMMAPPPLIQLPQQSTHLDEILGRIIPNFEGINVEFRTTLTELFKTLGVKVWISPELEGKISLSMRGVKFDLLFHNFCAQVNATFRYERDTFLIVKRSDSSEGIGGTSRQVCSFAPGFPSSQVSISQRSLFLSRKQTKGGSYDLLMESIKTAGFKLSGIRSYGKTGFAIVLPFESIDKAGKPYVGSTKSFHRQRFDFSMPYLQSFEMSKMGELFANTWDNLDHDYRLIVIAATNDVTGPNDQTSQNQRSHFKDDIGIPEDFRAEKWANTPTVKAFVYEFRRPAGQHLAVLLKPGQSEISARRHLIMSGLWTEKELR